MELILRSSIESSYCNELELVTFLADRLPTTDTRRRSHCNHHQIGAILCRPKLSCSIWAALGTLCLRTVYRSGKLCQLEARLHRRPANVNLGAGNISEPVQVEHNGKWIFD